MTLTQSVLQKEHVAMAFGTPISSYLWADSDTINAELKNVILQKEKVDQGLIKSNVGGWHSKSGLFLWEADCVRKLQERVSSTALDLTRLVTVSDGPRKMHLQLDCWANVSRRGDYNSLHDHPGATWSGVYYVSCGEPDINIPTNGKLEFIDPRVGVNVPPLDQGVLGGRYLVDPLPGLMVMFPGWLKHMVHPFFGSGERISIVQPVRTISATNEVSTELRRSTRKSNLSSVSVKHLAGELNRLRCPVVAQNVHRRCLLSCQQLGDERTCCG